MELAGFEVGPALAIGGAGRVHRGVHRATGEAVAIKLLTRTDSPTQRVAFEREAHAMASFDHPHLLPVYAYGHAPDGTPYMVLPLAEQGDLHAFVDALDWPTAGALLLQALAGLAHAHAHGVVHCDLKPENVLLRASPQGVRSQLTDFGIAHALRSTDGPAQVRGTPHYMAPEQLVETASIGPATDLYALGCMAYELTARRMPFDGRTPLAVSSAQVNLPPAPWTDAIGAPAALEGWLMRCLAKAPRDRWPGAAEALAALRPLVPAEGACLPARGSSDDAARTAVGLATPRLARLTQALDPSTARLAPPKTWRRLEQPRPLIGLGARLFAARARPLVGRDGPAGVIWRRVRAAHRHDSARVVVIEGGQGTGKSHLAQWLGVRADELGAARLAAVRYADASPQNRGLAGLLRALLQADGDLARISRLRGAPQVGPSDRTVHGLAFSGRRLTDGDAARTARVVLGWLSQWAAPRPLYLWLDDAHGHDEPLRLAEAALALDRPMVLVLTVRTDAIPAARLAEIEALAADRRVRRLPLPPLDAEAHRALIDRLLPLAPAVAADLVERTHGRPLFAVHVLADWLARDALLSTPLGLQPRTDSGEIDSLAALWSSRLRTVLGPIEAPDLGLAATLGEAVDDGLLADAAALAGVGVHPERFAHLARAGLARRTPRGWAFAHGLIRDAVRQRFGAPRLAAACARALTPRVVLPQDWRAVAEHWRAAGQMDAAIDAALKEYDGNAGNFTRRDYLERLDQIEADLDAVGAAPHDARRLRLGLRRVARDFATASVEVLVHRLQAIEAVARAQAHLAEWAEALRLRAIVVRNSVGPAPAEPLFREACEVFARAGDAHAAACATLGRCPCLRAMGRNDEAVAAARTALTTFVAHDDVWWTQITRVELADLLLEGDDFAGADALMEEALVLARGLNDPSNQARILTRLAERPLVQGQPQLAETYLLQAHDLYTQDENVNAALLPSWLTRVALHRGDLKAAARHYADHRAYTDAVTYRDEFPWLAIVPAAVASQRGDRRGWQAAWAALAQRAHERWPAEARRDLAAALALLAEADRQPLRDLLVTLR